MGLVGEQQAAEVSLGLLAMAIGRRPSLDHDGLWHDVLLASTGFRDLWEFQTGSKVLLTEQCSELTIGLICAAASSNFWNVIFSAALKITSRFLLQTRPSGGHTSRAANQDP